VRPNLLFVIFLKLLRFSANVVDSDRPLVPRRGLSSSRRPDAHGPLLFFCPDALARLLELMSSFLYWDLTVLVPFNPGSGYLSFLLVAFSCLRPFFAEYIPFLIKFARSCGPTHQAINFFPL